MKMQTIILGAIGCALQFITMQVNAQPAGQTPSELRVMQMPPEPHPATPPSAEISKKGQQHPAVKHEHHKQKKTEGQDKERAPEPLPPSK
ncbi:MAG TPA: hypothetical protein VMT94_04855 [Burkholderiales bacterium]|nr:hypothetical protein [Burkholderiales bacterium]